MNKWLLGLLALVPLAAGAQVSSGDLPENTVWYFHADLDALRDSESGGPVWQWMEGEVVMEVREDVGIDLGEEVDRVTAFASAQNGTVIVVEGPMTEPTREKILALAAQQGPVDPRDHESKEYYFFGSNEEESDEPSDDPFDDLEDRMFVSFAVDGKALITGSEAQMRELLENNGRIAGAGSHDGALLVLSANQPFVQAGLQKDGLTDPDDMDDDWESKIVNNTEQGALLLADDAGNLALQAQIVSSDPKMAEAIGGIVNGLIALQAFNSELEPEIQSLLQNTRVNVDENNLSVNMVIDPNLLVSVLED